MTRTEDATTTSSDPIAASRPAPVARALALVILWSLEEPERAGEILFVRHGTELAFGRGASEGPRAGPVRMRPGRNLRTEPLASRRLSREQAWLSVDGPGRLRVRNVGRCRLLHAGDVLDEVVVSPGDLLEWQNTLLVRCVERPLLLGDAPTAPIAPVAFGEADAYGIVGESPAAWALREAIASASRGDVHLLITGPSGSGKELVARAVHGLSPRGARPMVSRNAATFPDSLIDAELFGNVKDYPNAGMPERPGLIGAADGSTLFLDEIGELSEAMQAHLLRVLDAGEYQRLGEARVRAADLRLIAATNRDPGLLKRDFLARLPRRIAVPGLEERADDVPLLIRAVLRRMAERDPTVRERFFEGDEPRVTPRLVAELVEREWTGHVREIEEVLWEAVAATTGSFLDLPQPAASPTVREEATPTAEQVREALDANDGVVSRAWRDLGLRNRFQLARLMRRYGIER